MRGVAQNVDAPDAVLDHPQDVRGGAVEQVHREEVGGQDRLGLGVQEAAPGRSAHSNKTDPGYESEQQCDQRPVGPGDLRPGMLADLALQDSDLVLQQQDLRSAPGHIPTREAGHSEHARAEQEDETQTHKS